jgi:steroid 5-alpha reductase family enzyme
MSPIILSTYVVSLLTVIVYMTGWFVVALAKKRNDLADIAWGPGFILVAWVMVFFNQAFTARPLLVATLITIWGLRLAWHIAKRNKGKSEDFRYKKWRDEWGKWFYVRTYLQVFVLQGVLLTLVIMPLTVITSTDISASLSLLDALGVLIFIIGLSFEAIGDLQLSRFLAQKDRAPVMRTGLWAYTRHPNYFGEVSLWWGIFIISLSAPMGWMGIIGVLTITLLILGVSGIPMLERRYIGNKDYEEYQRQTSAFFPLPSRK